MHFTVNKQVKEADPAFSSLVLGFSPSGLEGRRIDDVIPGFYEEFEVKLLLPFLTAINIRNNYTSGSFLRQNRGVLGLLPALSQLPLPTSACGR